MMKLETPKLLSEILRPKTLSDMILTDILRQKLRKISQDGWVMNATFFGSPGVGKTTAVRILIAHIDADSLTLNGSLSDGDKTIVRRIETFASCVSFYGRPKVVVIEEADQLTKNVQESLRYVIENTSSNCRYLLIVNDLSRVSDAIKSRCIPICFDVPRKEIDAVVEQAVKIYNKRLSEEAIKIDAYIIEDVIQRYFPDFRAVTNHFQMEI